MEEIIKDKILKAYIDVKFLYWFLPKTQKYDKLIELMNLTEEEKKYLNLMHIKEDLKNNPF